MATSVTMGGVSYSIPASSEIAWGNQVSGYLIAVAANTLQKSGGSFALTADINFGSNFGLTSKYLKSISSNIAQSGVMRLANTDKIGFRNNANSADLSFGVSTSDRLQFEGVNVPTVSSADTFSNKTIAAGSNTITGLTNSSIASGAAIAYSKLSLTGSIINADISASAAIAGSKINPDFGSQNIVTTGSISGTFVDNGNPPVGSIIAYAPGYFSAAANGGSWNTVGPSANTISAVNTYLPANWRVCDGTALNDAGSPIFNGAGRYLPDLTGNRFIRGATSAGSSGGAASVTLTTNELPAHTHSAGSYATSIGLSGSAPSLSNNTVASASHAHQLNTTSASKLVVQAVTAGGTNKAVQTTTIPGSDLSSVTDASSNQTVTISGGSYSLTGSNSVAGTSGSSGSGNSFSIVPLYLNAFYIMRVK